MLTTFRKRRDERMTSGVVTKPRKGNLAWRGILVSAVVGTVMAIIFGWTGVGDWRPLSESVDESPTPASIPPTIPPEVSVTPTPSSELATARAGSGILELTEGTSALVDDAGLRISTGYIFETFARIGATTDASNCEARLNVGESLVFSNRSPGDADYSEWYAVTLVSTQSDQASLEWSFGSGAAPRAPSENSCV